MNIITITIAYDKDQKLLIFNDGKNIGIDITTAVQKGDLVVWKLANFSDISSIEKIVDLSKENIFYPNPKRNDDGSWQATVVAGPGTKEAYEVHCNVKEFVKRQDPKIQVH